MSEDRDTPSPLSPLTPESFALRLVAGLASETAAVTGEESFRDIVSLTGLEVGAEIEGAVAPDIVDEPEESWTPKDLGGVLVELKDRINGDFTLEEATAKRVVLTNKRCPFGADVDGRPALCMMTSSVFGGIAARRFGWARVDIQEAIARGHPGCRVVVHLQEPADAPGEWSHVYHGEE